MEPVQFNFTLNLHLDAPKTTYKIPLFQPTDLPACTTTSSCIHQDAKISSELEKLLGQGDGATVYKVHHKKMKRKRAHNDKYDTIYLNKLVARFQDQPEKIQGFKTVMADIVAHTDRDQSGRLKDIPDETLDRVAAIFEGHDDLLREFNTFLPPSHQLSLDDDGGGEEEEENVADAAEKKEPGLKDALDFFKNVRILRGVNFYEAFLRTLFPLKNGSRNSDYVYRDALALLADEPDLLEGFYRFLPVSKSIPLAYHARDSQDLDINNKRAVLVNAVKEQKHSKKLEVGEENDKDRNFVNRARGVAAGDGESVIEKLMSDGLCFFGKVKERLSCNFSYERFLKLFFYYTKDKFGEGEWKTMVATIIGKHSDLTDEFNDFMVKCKNIQESRRCERRRDRKRAKRESQVLNDDLASVASRTEDYSSNSRGQNQRQKIMFRCEDDRNEMDMLLTWFKSAVEYAEELGEGIDEGKITKGKRIHFLRCVERLYDDQGLEVLDVFDKDPQRALPILKHRLKQKLEKLKDWRNDLQKLWDEVVSRVY